MKNIAKNTIFFIMPFLLCSCVKETNLNLESKAKKVVVDGNIYNTPGPYYVRLTLTNPALSDNGRQGGIDYVEPIVNAFITIDDNSGNVDTLKSSPDSISGYSKFYRSRTGPIDSFFRRDANYFNGAKGFYQTTKLIGVPGRTYTLKILYKNQEYRASAFMPPVTTIDSVEFIIRQGIKDNITYRVPSLFFLEPQSSIDYYWTFVDANVNDLNLTAPLLYSTREIIPYSIFNDKFLLPNVKGIYSDYTYTKNSLQQDIIRNYGFVYLGSLTEGHYNFLKTLVDQIQSDGGSYKPTPATPPSNISNGGLGFFGASALSRKFAFSPDFQ